MGCPAGVGPEISVAAAAALEGASAVLVGDEPTLRRAAELVGVAARRLVTIGALDAIDPRRAGVIYLWGPSPRLSRAPRPGKPSREDGAQQLAYVDEALRLVVSGGASALVTAPVSKEAIATSGARGTKTFRGHTEHLQRRLRAPEVVMAFYAEEMVTSLVTTHLPLARVARAITPESVVRATYWLSRLLRDLGQPRPRVVIAGLNPHAGEGGLLGHEEIEAIAPGVELARERLARDGLRAKLTGPIGAETAFRRAKGKGFDGVVAMYHDQATIPMKLLSFGDAVNVTLGLPVIRTSVDHGTAHDIAWKGVAEPRAMLAALELAVRLAAATKTKTKTKRRKPAG
jgi:4-hydroxythreonine-4-phosphate dehydrogenase